MFDETKAREFYLGFLGCKVDFEHRFEPGLPLYMQVSRGDLVLHLSEHHGDCTPGATVLVQVRDGIEALHAELIAKAYRYNRPGLDIAPWNAKVMEVTDPFGNRLRFNQPLQAP
ncbi:MAG: VOC family protein [Rhodospirillaceae bacterium]|nr:VOC family protein [Rhodospirillaceae bacterium]